MGTDHQSVVLSLSALECLCRLQSLRSRSRSGHRLQLRGQQRIPVWSSAPEPSLTLPLRQRRLLPVLLFLLQYPCTRPGLPPAW